MWCCIIDLVVVGKWLFLLFHEMTWIVFVTSLFAALFILLKDNSIIVSASVWYHPREKIRDNPNFPRMLFNLTKIKFSFLIYLTFKELHGSRPLMPFRYHWKYHCITVPSLNMYNVQRIFILLSACPLLPCGAISLWQILSCRVENGWLCPWHLKNQRCFRAQTIKLGCPNGLLMLEVSASSIQFSARVLAPAFLSSESWSYLNRLMWQKFFSVLPRRWVYFSRKGQCAVEKEKWLCDRAW